MFLGLLCALPAAAQPRIRAAHDPEQQFLAEYRLLTHGLTSFPIDDQRSTLGQNAWAEQRLRLMGKMSRPGQGLTIELGLDLFTGMVAGQTTTVGAEYVLFPRHQRNAFERVEPRRLMVAWRSRIGELRLGHTASNWGLGILANNGESNLPFGYAHLGDLVERAAFATMPAQNLYVAAAVDLVYRDTNANLSNGDVAINTVGSLFYRTRQAFLGVYGGYRHQNDKDGDKLRVGVLDASGKIRQRLGRSGLIFGLGFEALALFGSTDRLRPEGHLEGVTVRAGGAVVRATLSHRPSRVGLTTELGYASGDNDRGDDVARAASFHPDYAVGMVLFPEVLAAMSARAADRAGDRAHVAVAPSGTENVPSNGSVTNALYVWTHFFLRPVRGLTLRAGLLYARSAADLVDPYLSFRAGGVNRNFLGGAGTARELGFEVHASARYRWALTPRLGVNFGLDWGHLFPGEALNDAAGRFMGGVDRVVGRFLLDWRYQ
ncbi:MAG: hypothetical protein IT371_22555 [Deltaproteobacteria bacterium]|nr:hypothetical protein [Deltaproteobacteria bacterium]